MQYNYKDFKRFHSGLMDIHEAENFLIWLESVEGELTFQKWISEQWEGMEQTEKEAKNNYKFASKKPTSFISLIQKYAAIALLLLSAVFVFYINKDSDPPSEFQTTIQHSEIIKTVAKGNKKTITLSDGSKVYLNSESSIAYMSNFKEDRQVKLTGEAFFEVVTDSSRPFKVITGDVTTVALGTSFNINSYGEKNEILISLATGKIVVEANIKEQNQYYVNPGEGIGFSLASMQLSKRNVDIEKIIQWKSGILQFESLPLDQVLLTLERWYGVDIHFKGDAQIPFHKCTGKFKPNEYLSNVLQALSYSIEFDFVINDKQVVIDFK